MKKTSKWILCLLALCMMTVLCSCGAKKDKAYLKNLAKGLEARWAVSSYNADVPDEYEVDYAEQIDQMIKAEETALGNLEDYKFEDSNLEDLANKYQTALSSCKEGIKYYKTDEEKFKELYTEKGQNVRVAVISELVENYEFSVSKEYASTLSDVCREAQILVAEQEQIAAMEELLAQGIALVSTSKNQYDYTIKNTTEYDLTDCRLHFNLYDESGLLVDSYEQYANHWKPGTETKNDIYTDVEFVTAELAISIRSTNSSKDLMTEYASVSVDDKYGDAINSYRSDLESILKKETPVLNCIGGTNYSITLENTTSYDLSSAYIYLAIYDENDRLIKEEHEYVSSWAPGSFATEEFNYLSDKISNAKIALENYPNEFHQDIKTEYFPVTISDEMSISVNLKNDLPASFDEHDYNGSVAASCDITDFTYNTNNWYNGTCNLEFAISGTKTADSNESTAEAFHLAWKLLDDDGTIIDSGSFYTDRLKINEKFKDCEASAYHIAPGTYTIELYEYR